MLFSMCLDYTVIRIASEFNVSCVQLNVYYRARRSKGYIDFAPEAIFMDYS